MINHCSFGFYSGWTDEKRVASPCKQLLVHGITRSKREQLSSGKLLAAKLELLVIYKLGENIVPGQGSWWNSLVAYISHARTNFIGAKCLQGMGPA